MDLSSVFHSTVEFIHMIDKLYAHTQALLLINADGQVLCAYDGTRYEHNPIPSTYFHANQHNAITLAMKEKRLSIVSPEEHPESELCEHYSIAVPLFDGSDVIGYLGGLMTSDFQPEIGRVLFAAYAKYFETELAQQKTLTQQEEKLNLLNTVLKAIPFGCIILDQSGVVTYANERSELYSGVPAKNMVGTSMKQMVQGNDLVDTVLTDGVSIVDQEVFLHKLNPDETIQAVRTTMPVISGNKVVGAVDMLREMHSVKKMVNQFSGNQAKYTFSDIIHQSQEMKQVIAVAKNIAFNTHPVLIESESGTGKELLAQAIHNASPRRDGPFVVLDCSAIPKDLAESELFGYASGAFTGAVKGGKIGKAELANGGTLFLDEIGELPLQLQIKLLRFLQTKTFTRVGDTRPLTSNARIIAATNRNLRSEIEANNFRLDLYFRLNVFSLRLPPLRDRPEDIPFLAGTFLHRYEREFGKSNVSLAPETIQYMLSYSWPGNVRELENYMIRCLALCQESVLPEHLPFFSASVPLTRNTAAPVPTPPTSPDLPNEKAVIQEALTLCNGNMSKAALQLGMSRQTLYNRIAELGLSRVKDSARHPLSKESIRSALEAAEGNKSSAAKLLGISRKTLYQKLKEFFPKS